jgi:hypothetical protein
MLGLSSLPEVDALQLMLASPTRVRCRLSLVATIYQSLQAIHGTVGSAVVWKGTCTPWMLLVPRRAMTKMPALTELVVSTTLAKMVGRQPLGTSVVVKQVTNFWTSSMRTAGAGRLTLASTFRAQVH